MKRPYYYLPHLLLFCSLIVQSCSSATATSAPATTAPTAVSQSAGEAATQPAGIQHIAIPGNGSQQLANAHDNDEWTYHDSKDVQTGDQFKLNRFERPFTSKNMDYMPSVDIKNMTILSDDTWYYIDIEFAGFGNGNTAPNAFFGAEFDLNGDGHAEFMILASPPYSSEWSTDGVSVHSDLNGNIGGEQVYPDPTYAGDGYETLVVDSGQGTDPDLAWSRFPNADKTVVELAIKRSVFEEAKHVMWDVFASANPVNPMKFYLNDTMTFAKAGSPRKTSKFYPVKALWGFDNTCRVPLGFPATGTEPMSCAVAATSQSESEDAPDTPLPPALQCPPQQKDPNYICH